MTASQFQSGWRFGICQSALPFCALLFVAVGGIIDDHVRAQTPGEWQASEWHLWRISPDGTGLRAFCDCSGYRCGSPVWSPVGKLVACDAWLMGQSSPDSQIVVIRADGSGFHPIGPGCIPSWSRDGNLVLADSRGPIIMNADGSGRETVFGASGFPRWSRRDDLIVSVSMVGIYQFDLATGGSERIVIRSASPSHPSVSHGWDISPDGRRICFGSDPGLLLATLDETTKSASVRVLAASGVAYHTSWAPDGRNLVFAWRKSDDALTQLYTLDVDSNDEPKLLPGLDTTHQNVNPAWSPDGETIIFSCPEP